MRKAKVSFGDMGLYGSDISDEMNRCLDESWKKQYGLEITDVAIGDINLTDESMKRVSRIDDAKIFSNQNLQSGLIAESTAKALENASSNSNGAMMGFASMNMASNAASNLMGQVNQNVTGNADLETSMPEPGTIFKNENIEKQPNSVEEDSKSKANFCSNCGSEATGNFCSNCGAKLN
jgi:membrane protease subunit (stomatin/prohibitin family)